MTSHGGGESSKTNSFCSAGSRDDLVRRRSKPGSGSTKDAEIGTGASGSSTEAAIAAGEADTFPKIAKFAKQDAATHNMNMDPITRPELDAKLNATEARIEAMIARIEGAAKVTSAEISHIRMDMEKSAEHSKANVASLRQEISDLGNYMKSLKTTVIVTGVGAILTIVFGVWGVNTAVLSNMVASFDSGRETATVINGLTNKVDQLLMQVEKSKAAQP